MHPKTGGCPMEETKQPTKGYLITKGVTSLLWFVPIKRISDYKQFKAYKERALVFIIHCLGDTLATRSLCPLNLI